MFASLEGNELIDKKTMEAAAAKQEAVMEVAGLLIADHKKIAEAQAEIVKRNTQIEALTPWMSLEVAMNYPGTKKTSMLLGTMAAETTLECIINDYLTFIVLLFGLFCVSGNITLSGDLAGSPRINVGLLALGTLLSSWIGTTGASMLMIRPVVKMNAWRKKKRHIIIFFIFLVSNIGGCLTPIGDPPLLMGFMRGVPFFWSLHLAPILFFNMLVLLTIFYFIDKRAYRQDIASGLKPDISKPGVDIKVEGLHNIVFLVAIVVAVILSGTLPSLSLIHI